MAIFETKYRFVTILAQTFFDKNDICKDLKLHAVECKGTAKLVLKTKYEKIVIVDFRNNEDLTAFTLKYGHLHQASKHKNI